MRYNPSKIERKWQARWLKEGTYEPDLKRARKPFYNLMMFPYPSAEGLHIGAMRTFSGVDMYGRLKRMQGHAVFEPIGLDGFGIHSENYALKVGKHPTQHAKDSEKNFYRQLAMMGNGFAWRERLETYDPDYYRWTQWIFIQMFKRGLAYRKKQAVNWCPSCKTVLADEQVVKKSKVKSQKSKVQVKIQNGQIQEAETLAVCERCETPVIKKELEQWFFRITEYADRLLKNLEKLDWSERVKVAQREWIGKSEGALIQFKMQNAKVKTTSQNSKVDVIEVFTTRPDTLFGATYLVLGPEHPFIQNQESRIKNYGEVKKYIQSAKAKSEEEWIAEGREKTGVELKDVTAINPANGEEIPVWVADYVLGNVGTGAIMGVPAHDQRDLEFAQKFRLPIRQVVAPSIIMQGTDTPRSDKNVHEFDAATAIIKHWEQKDRFYIVEFSDTMRGFVGGHVEHGESREDTARREIKEESGYSDIRTTTALFEHAYARGYKTRKSREERCSDSVYVAELGSGARTDIIDHETRKGVWRTSDQILNDPFFATHHKVYFEHYIHNRAFSDVGKLVNSGKFTGMGSERAKQEIVRSVGGKRVTRYHLRDWLISRQRYWAPPIPMIFCEACAAARKGERHDMPGWYAAPEKSLPVKLPFIKNFRPTGTDRSPLAGIAAFYRVRCPGCNAWARRETDVSDTFLDSAWYYLRYPSVREKKHPWNAAITKKWLPVNRYIGGAEHSVLHLLYVRFLAMALHDAGLVHFDEPMPSFRAHGLITKDGAKMSKSKGNVVNPDEYIRAFGADAMRLYLAFMAPFEQGGDFRDSGIKGLTRFLERAWKLISQKSKCKMLENQRFSSGSPEPKASGRWQNYKSKVKTEEIGRSVHKTIKKVTEDIESLHYNTAISALMVLLNELEQDRVNLKVEDLKIFLKLLAPFAPHITEELWQQMNAKPGPKRHSAFGIRHSAFKSIHLEKWPVFDPRLVKEDTTTVVLQVNGRVRDQIVVERGATKAALEKAALASPKIQGWVKGGKPSKIIVVPDRLVNIVV